MSEESAETPDQPNKKLINLLGGIAFTLAILMIMLVLAALGFLLYGLLAAKLDVSIGGVVVCVIGFILLFGLFRLLLETLRRKTHGRAGDISAALTTGRETYTKVKDELHTRYQSEQEEKRHKRRENYARVKDELSTRYGRAKTDKD